MKKKLNLFILSVAFSVVMISCTGKIDSMLNKEEKALDKYEAKAKAGKAKSEDLKELQSELSALTEDLKDISVEKDITPEQEKRGEQLAERYADIVLNQALESTNE